MQAKGYLHGSVSLSTEHRGKPRQHPVWVIRYRLPSGKDSRKTLRGDDRNRTGVDGFAGRCVATPPRRRGT
jgi:hypothetical protein